jgi:hypothetical protein
MSRWGQRWFQQKVEKPDKRGPYTFFKDKATRKKRAEAIFTNRARLEEAARLLRTTGDHWCYQAATLVDAAIEALDEGLVNLSRDEPRDKPDANDK